MRFTLLSAALASLGVVCFALPAAAEEAASPASAATPAAHAAPAGPRAHAGPAGPAILAAGAGAAVSPKSTHGLTRVHGDLTSDASASAGSYRAVELSARPASAPKPVRLPASPRVLRRMNADRSMAVIDPSIRACASVSTTVSPTSFGLRVVVGPAGDVEAAELAQPASVPAPILACVIKAVSAARFASPGAGGAAVAVPVQVPGRVASHAAAPADAAPADAAPVPAPAPAPATATAPAEGPVATR